MYCFDDQWHAQCMRLYIHIEKYQNGSIDICVMRFGSACMKGTNPSDVEYIQTEIKESRHNAVNILRLQKDVDKILIQIETLKDKVRSNGNNSHD